jgi:hypothetical protein
MLTSPYQLCGHFAYYASQIQSLPQRVRFTKEDLLVPAFEVYCLGDLVMYYAPLDCLNPSAELIFLGITPSWMEMERAYQVAQMGLHLGWDAKAICHYAKQKASFAGPMRNNLIQMLDLLGLPAHLGIPSSEALFDQAYQHVQISAMLRYPTFVNGHNYNGHSPDILATPELRHWVEQVLAKELQQVAQAVIVPLGKAVARILRYLADKEVIAEERCLFGFPHPSGGNGHRLREFTAQRERLTQQLTFLANQNHHTDKGDNDE